MEILQVKNLSFRYPNAAWTAVTSVDFSMEAGEFAVLCGASGCGKTTLLRLLKPELAPQGEKSGEVIYGFSGNSASRIGFVGQNPDEQIVTDRVWHELAFGLENMGLPADIIRRRVGEMASYFGIQTWFHQKTDDLSGGQKQLLNLASVMVMQPDILLLDEPTSQLDPIAAADFVATLRKLNQEFGLTVLLVEHRLEEVLSLSDRVLLMERGTLRFCGVPADLPKYILPNSSISAALPIATRVFCTMGMTGTCPLTVREGKKLLKNRFAPQPTMFSAASDSEKHGTVALEVRQVWFRYEKDLPDVLHGISFSVFPGELFALLGGNGSGKTTTLHVISGLLSAYRGDILFFGKSIRHFRGNALYRGTLSLLPQNPQEVFSSDTVRADLWDILAVAEVGDAEKETTLDAMAKKFGIYDLLDRHPLDLSGGEQQKCALAKVLLTKPRVLLLDEPTKGLDADAKRMLGGLLRNLAAEGMTILCVTHDLDFAAENADRCALLFDGEILSCAAPRAFFSGNAFYTTPANRMIRGLCPDAVTYEDILEFCKNGETL